MKTQSQIMMIALAISFAMGLALTVALICVSYVRNAPDEPITEDTTETQAPAPQETASETPEEVTTAPEPILPDVSNGLRFMSNGDGTCILTGIGTCTDACVVVPEYSPYGDRVVEIAPRALYGCTTITAIQIPASVRLIGDLAFAACGNLVYISVNDSNPFYCDVEGILYTSDESTLLLYPPMRAGNVATIRAVTTNIADMAFYGCTYLTSVSYTGTAEQWEYIRIGSKNYSLTAASKTFADSKQ